MVALVDDKHVPIPINRTTINELYGLDLTTDEEVQAFYDERAEPMDFIANSEDVVVAKVGRELYEKFFQGYTRKQWERDPSELDKSVCARIPLRTNDGRPLLRRQVPEHARRRATRRSSSGCSTTRTSRSARRPSSTTSATRSSTATSSTRARSTRYFDHRFGKLPYRSLEFEMRRASRRRTARWSCRAATVNYPSFDVPWTRGSPSTAT